MSKVRVPEIPWAWAWTAVVLVFPWSNAFMSIATAWLGLVTISHALNPSHSVRKTPFSKALGRTGWALMLLVLWSGLSVLWGGEPRACLHDVRVKLPLAVGGWAMVTMARSSLNLEASQVKFMLKMAVISAGLATLSLMVWDILDGGQTGGRQSSHFISHIRFGLWWALLLPWTGHLLGRRWMWGCLIGAVTTWTWMQGATGLLAGVAMAPWWLSALGKKKSGIPEGVPWPPAATVRRHAALIALGLVPVVLLLIRALPTALPQAEGLPEQTQAGETYVHKTERRVTENGHFVWTHLAWGELKAAWGQRSDTPYDEVQGALVRFLTSKGLAKDAEGVAALSAAELEAVANRVTSTVELEGGSWQKRWNRFKFNWGQWLDGHRSPNASVLARAVYMEVAVDAWFALPLLNKTIGVGAGRAGVEIEEGFMRSFPDWPPAGRKRPHNQYLTFALALGTVGLGLLLYALSSMWAHSPCQPGVVLLALSCLTEDTLETQAGVTLAVVALALGAFVKVGEARQ